MLEKKYTYQYAQPSEYHFSLDSIELPYRAAKILQKKDLSQSKVLDLCSGCGVIGFEFHFYHPDIQEIHFLEVQREAYESCFSSNCHLVPAGKTLFKPLWLSYDSLLTEEYRGQYQLILSNPPYFVPGQGKLSPSDFKNRCRFFLDSTFERWADVILHCLSPGASAFTLLRPLQEHGKNLRQGLENQFQGNASVQVIDLIRGTEMLQIQRTV